MGTPARLEKIPRCGDAARGEGLLLKTKSYICPNGFVDFIHQMSLKTKTCIWPNGLQDFIHPRSLLKAQTLRKVAKKLPNPMVASYKLSFERTILAFLWVVLDCLQKMKILQSEPVKESGSKSQN